jgi:putative flavoprotein involved in K+ transport
MKTLDSIVIGAGQAGLAAGYYLRRAGLRFEMLDGGSVGDTWSQRWDSLRLFTPVRYNSLPGLRFPGRPYELPGKDDVARYLRDYAARFALPVREGARVLALQRQRHLFHVGLDGGETLAARSVIVATGANQRPWIPALAAALDPRAVQLHSSEYRRPALLPAGRVLVAGVGNSGAQIALELAGSGRDVLLAGPDTGAVPRRLLGRDIFDWIWHTKLRTSTDSARGRARLQARRFAGDTLVGTTAAHFARAGVRRVGRVVATRAGQAVLEDGSAIDGVAAVVWSTGFRPDYSWIELPVFGLDGYPRHQRGVALDVPGLAFVGMRYQYRARSALLGGVGEDAAHVVERIVAQVRGAPVTLQASLATSGGIS